MGLIGDPRIESARPTGRIFAIRRKIGAQGHITYEEKLGLAERIVKRFGEAGIQCELAATVSLICAVPSRWRFCRPDQGRPGSCGAGRMSGARAPTHGLNGVLSSQTIAAHRLAFSSSDGGDHLSAPFSRLKPNDTAIGNGCIDWTIQLDAWPEVRNGSSTERLKVSISRPLFSAKQIVAVLAQKKIGAQARMTYEEKSRVADRLVQRFRETGFQCKLRWFGLPSQCR
jgi:hypothetical protein